MKYIKRIYTAALILAAAGCSKDKLNITASNIILADNLYVNKAGFEAGLNGLYFEVRRSRSGYTIGDINGMMLTAACIGVDNAYGNYLGAASSFNIWGAASNPSLAEYRQEWAWLYETVNAANTLIARAENPAVVWTAAEKNTAVAEARAIRAWCYRHLTYSWGAVPLVLTESSGSNIRTDFERTPVAEIRNAMEADWLFAEQYLPETSSNQGKILKGAVQHYLAELYVTQKKFDKARDYALKVTTNPAYKLVTARYGVNASKPGSAFTDMFIDGNVNRNQGNTEALWVMQAELNVIGGEPDNVMRRYWVNRYYSLTVGGKSPFLVSAENGGRGIGRFGPTRWAFSIYPANDDRGGDYAWSFYWNVNNPAGIPTGYVLGQRYNLDRTTVEKVNNPNWPSTRKWDYTSPVDVNVDRAYKDQPYIRSAETWLLLAEAYLGLGDLNGAATAINALRARANAPLITAAQVTLDFILDERSRELFSEEDRRYTLVRTGKFVERVKLYNNVSKATIADRDTLLPIPQSVIDANLTKVFLQNAGY